MKFSDGYWLNQKGYTVNYASQAYETEITETSVKILVTPTTSGTEGRPSAVPTLK